MLITFADTMNILNEKKVYDEAVERLEAAKEDYLSYYNKYQDQIASGADESSPDLISLGSAVRKAKREALNALNDAKDAKQNLLIAMDEAVAKSSNKKGKDKRKAAEKQRSINKAITEADNWYMKQRNDIDSYVLDTEADTKKIRDSVDDQKRMTILANYVKLYREMLEKKEELRLLPISDPSVREERLQLKEAKSDLEDKLDTLEQKNPALAADFEEQRKKLNNKVSNNYKDERAEQKTLDTVKSTSEISKGLDELESLRVKQHNAELDEDTDTTKFYRDQAEELYDIYDTSLSTLESMKSNKTNPVIKRLRSRLNSLKDNATTKEYLKSNDTKKYSEYLNELRTKIQEYKQVKVNELSETNNLKKYDLSSTAKDLKERIDAIIIHLDSHTYTVQVSLVKQYENLKTLWSEIKKDDPDFLKKAKEDLKNEQLKESWISGSNENVMETAFKNGLYVLKTDSGYVSGWTYDDYDNLEINYTNSIVLAKWSTEKDLVDAFKDALGLSDNYDAKAINVKPGDAKAKLLVNRKSQQITEEDLAIDDSNTESNGSSAGNSGHRTTKSGGYISNIFG